MDVKVLRKFLGLVGLAVFCFGCNQKNVESTFKESSNKPGASCEAERIPNRFIVNWVDGHSSLETYDNQDVFIEEFLKPRLHEIERVEFDKRIKLEPVTRLLPQDILRGTVETPSDDWGPVRVLAPKLWDAGIQGENIAVAVVDTLVDYKHPQIQPRVLPNVAELNGKAGVDDDGNGFVDDVYGWDFVHNQPIGSIENPDEQTHGTHVSGIILADHDKGVVQGMAPKAQLIPANFMESDVSGGTLDDAIKAMNYAASRGAKVINASWGGGSCSESLQVTMKHLSDQGVLLVVASGNAYANLDYQAFFPAVYNLENQLTVAASNFNDKVTAFSNTSFKLVHLAAPGEGILSTVPRGVETMDGTSMAAPFVSGAAALLWSAKPSATASQIKTAILKGVDVFTGYRVLSEGRLDVKKSLDYLQSN